VVPGIAEKWYKHCGGAKLAMYYQLLSNVSAEWMELYAIKTLSKPMFLLEASLALNFQISDDSLMDVAGKWMKVGKAPWPSKSQANTII
jgi:hypothetical protein